MKLGDEELMIMFKSGADEAFDMLYERYKERIYRFALTSTRSREEAKDVVQDVFMRVIISASRYQSRGRFKEWIFQIAGNRIRTLMKKRRDEKSARPNGKIDVTTPMNSEQGNQLKRMLHLELLGESLSCLSDTQRMILLLKEVEGMDVRSIANCLDMSSGNIRVHLHRGRKKMIDVLNNLEKKQ